MIVDRVEVKLVAGKGGDGIVSWRREKFVPKGGPDGGDGGRGGSILLIATHNLDTLSSFRYRKVFQAEDGKNGGNKRQTGPAGDDLELLVPLGTVVTDFETGRHLVDLTTVDQRYLIAKGGQGGLGNPHFAHSTNQRPTESTSGTSGQTRNVRLELQLIADIALVGEPNAGKSSLLAALTGVEARIAPYAFSTTEPILGVMHKGDQAITLVDLPGLIEGAHRGKGLGDKFLQHAKRVKALIQVVDSTNPQQAQSQAVIQKEIAQFGQELTALPFYVIYNKIDLLSAKEKAALQKAQPKAILFSALTKENLESVKTLVERVVA